MLLLCAILVPLQMRADDSGLILNAGASHKIKKGLNVDIEAEFRSRNDFRTADRVSLSAGISYKLLSWLKASGGYDLLIDHNRETITYQDDDVSYNNWRPSYWGLRHRNGRTVWEAAVVQIALGGIGMLLFRNDLLQAAGSVLIGGICNLLFFVLWNRFMLKDLVASGYCSNLKLFRVDPAKLPDVQKGEAYVEKESSVNINFAALLKGKLPYVIFAVSLAALLLVSGNAEKTALWKALCVAAIVIALAEVYVLFAYKDRYALMPLFLCFDAMIGIIAAVAGTGKFAGMVLCAVALSAVGLFTLISTYRSEFKGIAREKLNDDKISKFVNGLLGRFTENYCYAAVMFLVLVLALAITAKNMQIFTACVVVRAGAFVSASLLASKGWMEQITKFIERKPKKSNKKKGGKERSETVIFGLNEVK